MKPYVILLRGINVGGKNKIPMAELKNCLEEQGFKDVNTYIQSGNVLLHSNASAELIRAKVETALTENFHLDSKLIKALVLGREQFQTVIDNKPPGFGEQPEKYHSDVIFLMGIDETAAMAVFNPREGVDQIWPGQGVIYSQRLSSRRTQSRLSQITGTLPYKSMTIRNWNTTMKLLELLKASDFYN